MLLTTVELESDAPIRKWKVDLLKNEFGYTNGGNIPMDILPFKDFSVKKTNER